MKRALVLSIALMAKLCLAYTSSPSATQSWVAHFVATAAVGRVNFNLSPISVNVTNDQGEVETVNITFRRADCAALRVEDSNVAGMSNGTLFAENGENSYANTANTACTGFAGAIEQFGWMQTGGHYQYVTNGTSVATNVVYDGTNEVWMLRFALDVGGEMFMSTEIRRGYHYCVSLTNPSRHFRLRGVKITDEERDRLLASRTSFLDILFPSAYAATLGTRPVVGTHREGDYLYDEWEQHYYTDAGDAIQLKVGDVTITSANSGVSVTYKLDIVLLEVPMGVDLCSLSQIEVTTEEDVATVLMEENNLGPNRFKQVERSSAWKEVLDRIAAAKEIANGIAMAVASCPVTGTTPTYSPLGCECSSFEGRCGDWRCVQCGKRYDSVDNDHPANHSFGLIDGGGDCKACVICGERSEHESDHGGWGDAVVSRPMSPGLHVCRCDCGKMSLFHAPKLKTVEYISSETPGVSMLLNPSACYEVWQCLRCGEVVDDMANDGGTVTAGPHSFQDNGKWVAISVENPMTGESADVCQVSYTCQHFVDGEEDLGCGAVRTENWDHAVDWSKAVIADQGDDTCHFITAPCVNGFVKWSKDEGEWRSDNPAWCGWTERTNEVHRFGAPETKRWDDPDYPATRDSHKAVYVCGSLDRDGNVVANMVDECGAIVVTNEAHHLFGQVYGDPDETTHAVSNFCWSCHGIFLAPANWRMPHRPSGADRYNYRNRELHTVSNCCYVCSGNGYWYPVGTGTERHLPAQLKDEVAYVYTSAFTHTVSNFCRKCQSWYYRGEEEHVAKSEAEPTRCVPLPNLIHDEYNVCAMCRKPGENGDEDAEFLWHTNVACSAGDEWTLNDAATDDQAKCKWCSNLIPVEHKWDWSEYDHICRNGGGHLMGGHVFPMGEVVDPDNICVCGKLYVAPPAQCPNCACCTERSACNFWNGREKKCACPECEGSVAGSCRCRLIEDHLVDGIGYGVVADDGGMRAYVKQNPEEHPEWTFRTGDVNIPEFANVNNLQIPVEELFRMGVSSPTGFIPAGITSVASESLFLTSVFDAAFLGCETLESVSLQHVTAMGQQVFENCTALTNVSMPQVVNIGHDAFLNCSNLTSVTFPAATQIEGCTFRNCAALTNLVLTAASDLPYGMIVGCTPEAIHIHLAQSAVTGTLDVRPAAIHFPSNSTLNGVSYPVDTIDIGGFSDVPIVWEGPQD